MKTMKNNVSILAAGLLLILGIGFGGCEQESEVLPKTLEEYMDDLANIIAIDKPLVENCVVGYNKYDFKSETNYEDYTSAYLEVILEAEAVLADPDVTIADVIDVNMAMAWPGDNFHDNIWISDRRPLQELIVTCDTLRVHTPIGNEPGMAPQAAHDEFKTAIDKAKAIRSRSSTIERQVAEAVDELNPELDKFEEAIIE